MMKNAPCILAAALAVLAVADARTGGLRPGQARKLRTTTDIQEFYFSEMLSDDDSVVVLEDGPFKLTASCKTVTYDDSYYYYSSSYMPSYSSSSNFSSSSSYSEGSSGSGTMYRTSPAHSYYPPYYSSGSSSGCYNPCGPPPPCSSTSSSYNSSDSTGSSDDSMWHGYPCGSTSSSTYNYTSSYFDDDYYSGGYSYNESFAALELTFTATDADYLFGSPSYANYPNETALVGGYEAGESRTQTIFAGRDGGYGDMSTLQSFSGHYMTINGDTTIGIHKDWTEYLPGGNVSFPEGVDCMISGFITYVAPEN